MSNVFQHIKDKLEFNFKKNIKTIPSKFLIDFVNYCKDTYYTNQPFISDSLYDKILEYIKSIDPNNKVLTNIGAPVYRNKVKLPFFMGSLDKIKPEIANDIIAKKTLDRFMHKNNAEMYNISDKLDGISVLMNITIINNEIESKFYKRGDGDHGILIQFPISLDLSNVKSYMIKNNISNMAFRGELVIKKKYQSKFNSKLRNIISGIFNSKELNENIKYIDIIFYELITPFLNFEKQIQIIKNCGLPIVSNITINKTELTLDYLTTFLSDRRTNSKYEIDGVVINAIGNYKRAETGNPVYAIAFKSDHYYEVNVLNVEWNISKDGKFKPKIKIEPILIDGSTIQYTTGFNAKYIYDNKIGVNTKLLITKSGDVIPHIVKVLQHTTAKMPTDKEWYWDGFDIITKTIHTEQIAMKLLHFSNVLEIEGLKERTIKQLMLYNIINTYYDILELQPSDLENIEGFKQTKILNIINSINESMSKVDLTTFLAAIEVFGSGIGVKKIKTILTNIPDFITTYKTLNVDNLYNKLIDITGINNITAMQIIDNLDNLTSSINNIPPKYKHILNNNVNKKQGIFTNMTFVFTGFRDEKLKNFIINNGGEISETLVRKTSMLIKEGNASKKTEKADEYLIPIITKNDFVKKYNISL